MPSAFANAYAFIDGNKRTAFVTTLTFLRLNGFAMRPESNKGVWIMEVLVADQIDEPTFASWLATQYSRL